MNARIVSSHVCLLLWLLGSIAISVGPAQADSWAVDPTRSQLGFEILETGNPVSGQFARWTAEIRYDPAAPGAARVRVEVDTASAATGDRRRDQFMTGPDWLDSARVSRAIFEGEGFSPHSAGKVETTGTLRLRDGVHPLTLVFTLVINGDQAHVQGGATIVRTQFGIGHGQWAGQGIVGFEVGVKFNLVARRVR